MKNKIIEVIDSRLDIDKEDRDDLADKILEVVEDKYVTIEFHERHLKENKDHYEDYIKADSIEICPRCKGAKQEILVRPQHKFNCVECKGKGFIINDNKN